MQMRVTCGLWHYRSHSTMVNVSNYAKCIPSSNLSTCDGLWNFPCNVPFGALPPS